MTDTHQRIDGALLIDKPQGITSFQVVGRLRKVFGLKTVGHAGTLDPHATGLLIVLVGRATRLQDFFLGENKEYSGQIRLGVQTDTDDITGSVIESANVQEVLAGRDFSQMLGEIKNTFSGRQEQVPPLYSAIHVNGVRSYQRARRGQAMSLPSRIVDVQFDKLECEDCETLSFRVRVSKGTYIRSLARDIGRHLGTGGTLLSLVRNGSGKFSLEGAIGLDALIENGKIAERLISMEQLVEDFPRVFLGPDEWRKLLQGDRRTLKRFQSREFADLSRIALFNDDKKFTGLIEKKPEKPGNITDWNVRFLLQ